jgi:hypothetical protein
MENKEESDILYFNDYFDDWYYANQYNNDVNTLEKDLNKNKKDDNFIEGKEQ